MSQEKMKITETGRKMIVARDEGCKKRTEERREWAVTKCAEITEKMFQNENVGTEIDLLPLDTEALVEESEQDLYLAAFEAAIGVSLRQILRTRNISQRASMSYMLFVNLGDLYNTLKAALTMEDSDPASCK